MSKSSTNAAILRQALARTFEDPGYRPPPLPHVAMEVMTLSAREDTNVEDVVRVLERDEMLAGAVLRLVASPLYAGRAPIRTLSDAVLRLGISAVRNTVFEVALRKGPFQVPEYKETLEQVGYHSTATAYVSRIVCRQIRMQEDQAFLCGLLHDIGFGALLFALANEKGAKGVPLGHVWAAMDASHELASKVVTKLWGLPGEIAAVVGHHHHQHTGNTARIAAVICVAESIAGKLGAAVTGPPDENGERVPADTVSDIDVGDARSILGIDDRAMEWIQQDAELIVPQVVRTTH